MRTDLGKLALLQTEGDASHAAAALFSHAVIMLGFAAKDSSNEDAMKAFDKMMSTMREAFIAIRTPMEKPH